jgi:hypothetical protein
LVSSEYLIAIFWIPHCYLLNTPLVSSIFSSSETWINILRLRRMSEYYINYTACPRVNCTACPRVNCTACPRVNYTACPRVNCTACPRKCVTLQVLEKTVLPK